MGFQRKQRFVRCSVHTERLEARQMFSVVNVNPGNYIAAINGSNNGDTINFSSGTYGVNGGATVQLPGNRTYVGNGAVFQGGSGSIVNVGYTSNVNLSGFVFNGAEVSADYTNNLNFHNNLVENSSTAGGFVNTAMANSSVSNNTFTNLNCGVYGYPSGGNKVDNNRFDYVIEPIHFVSYSPANGLEISGNVVTHATRFGFELQHSINNLTVTNNYMSDWLQQGSGGEDSHIGISCTDGGSGNAPYTDQGQNINISNNVLVQSGPAQNVQVWAKSAVEIMGYSGITMNNNYVWNWGNYILNGAYGGVSSNNNTVVGGQRSALDSVPWNIGPISGSGDHLVSLGSSNPPSMPTNAGANVQASSGSTNTNTNTNTSTTPTTTVSSGSNSLSGQVANAPSSYNLTSLGSSDWAHWGRGGNSGNFDHKSSGGSQISNVSTVGSGANSGGYSDGSRSASWSDGSPAGSDSNDNGYIWSNGALNTGFSFNVPADTTTRTLTVIAGGNNTGTTLTAHLSDGSSADFTATSSASGIYTKQYTITYHASSANQHLTVTLLKTANVVGTNGSADLVAAYLTGGSTNSAPAQTSTPSSSNTSSGSGSFSGKMVSAASSYNLTAIGARDWAHWGRGNGYGNFDHKASGGSQISNVQVLGSGSEGAYYDSSRTVQWSDGTPTSSDSDHSYIWANNAIGAGYAFTAPADTTTRTLYVYAGGNSSGSTLTAHLSDGSAPDVVITASGNGLYTNLYTITYKAASAGQKLTLSYVKSTNINGSGGSVDLIAAALA